MPNVSIIEPAQYLRMPWKNGLGETLEIQKLEDNQGLRFRISQAAVKEDGVFSNFAGLHRTLVLLSGKGMTLDHKSENSSHSHILSKVLDMARFSGGDETHAILKNGKIEDLNIMVREADTKADVYAYFAPTQFDVGNNSDNLLTAFYANQPCEIRVNNKEIFTLEASGFLVIKQNTALCLMAGSGVFIRITA